MTDPAMREREAIAAQIEAELVRELAELHLWPEHRTTEALAALCAKAYMAKRIRNGELGATP